MRSRRLWALTLTAVLGAVAVPGTAAAPAPRADVVLVSAFHAGGPIRGAAVHDNYLYVSTPDRLTIWDLTDPDSPETASTAVSPRLIHGELLSTNGELLLLNEETISGFRTVDVWDVEDKTNPKLVGSIPSTPDEHVSCILDCKWAYGSEGSILDLRDASAPVKRDENWLELAGVKGLNIHRVDEYRNGFVVTAPRGWAPMTVDVRDPLHPRLKRQTGLPVTAKPGFLFSDLSPAGNRYLFTSTEFPDGSGCEEPHDGALLAFDMRQPRAPIASKFSVDSAEGCTGFYFSFHPDFENTGLIALPQSLAGVRIVKFKPGRMQEMGSFVPAVADMWLTFWIDEEFFYALSESGEIYILRYVP